MDINGGVFAVVSVSEPYPSLWQLLSGAGERLLVYLGLGAVLGLLASWLLSRRQQWWTAHRYGDHDA